ncbi:YkgJ family cysteine cluster protein, partial [Klebsiella pneumoniae]|uniref:YkgJ family cysteine cluster protein n=1 Tax=Klebsiella pneumoniae TaxID=573 RepID=UPI002731EE85
CCIAPSISSPIPGMPQVKTSIFRCVHLSNDKLCNIFGSELRPKVCGNLQPSTDMCSTDLDASITYLLHLESSTAP